jgi:hypothetical protein
MVVELVVVLGFVASMITSEQSLQTKSKFCFVVLKKPNRLQALR